MTPPLLRVRNLRVELGNPGDAVGIVDDIDLDIRAGERVVLVGESGSGKSMMAQALMRLHPAARLLGSIRFNGTELLELPERDMAALRGSAIGMVFQDPMGSLDPVMRVGPQVTEPLRLRGVPKREACQRAIRLLEELGIADPPACFDAYPHELSGGMRQRAVIAMALISEPALLIADEPTTALDVRVQQQVLDVLEQVAARRALAVLLITHDLGIAARFADRILVMYSGRIIEDAPVHALFQQQKHPYARALLAATPRLDRVVERLASTPGAPPAPRCRPSGCAFHPRCALAEARCSTDRPALRRTGGRAVACHLAGAGEAAA